MAAKRRERLIVTIMPPRNGNMVVDVISDDVTRTDAELDYIANVVFAAFAVLDDARRANAVRRP